MDNIHMVYGAPGCGKTTRLMEILMDELERTDPARIAFVSFTRKGTYEGVERAKALRNLKDSDLPFFRTLHSIAFRLGEMSKHDMVSKSDYKEFSDAMGMKFTGYYTEDFYANDDKYLFMHFMKRNNPKMAELYESDINQMKLSDVENNYVRFKEFHSIKDFTDIIEMFIAKGEPLPVDVAIIDEAQDLTSLQWRMCEVAFSKCRKVYIAGDDDQAIYEWSGADVEYFLGIEATTKETLHQSYRLQRGVLDVAKRITGMIGKRVDKQFEPIADSGGVFTYNSLSEIRLNFDETWYFLSRNNWFLQKYSAWLMQEGRVFKYKDDLSIEKKEIDAINLFEHLRKHKKVTERETTQLKLHLKGAMDLDKPWYDNFNYPNDKLAYYRDLIRLHTDIRDRNLQINTIHGVKGGEADNVVLMLDFTRAVRKNMIYNPDSELRCLYVAMTRAKKNLHIVFSSTKSGYDNYIKECL